MSTFKRSQNKHDDSCIKLNHFLEQWGELSDSDTANLHPTFKKSQKNMMHEVKPL